MSDIWCNACGELKYLDETSIKYIKEQLQEKINTVIEILEDKENKAPTCRINKALEELKRE